MMTRHLSVAAAIAAVGFAILAACSGNGGGPFLSPPDLVRQHVSLGDGGDTLRPLTLQWFRDTLYVSYTGQARLDKFSGELELVGSVALTDQEPVFPTSFAVSDSLIVVTDHARGLVILYDHDGSVRTSFGTLPDGATPLFPFCVSEYRDVAYIGDVGTHRVMAVSLADREGLTELGELLLMIPQDSVHRIEFASALVVTPDGRLLVGDAGAGDIKAFTCDGRFVYRFDSLRVSAKAAPLAFAIDDIIDPSLVDSTSFDPSGVRRLGRIHVADGNNGRLHVFNPLGRYAFSYGEEIPLVKPTGLAFDARRGMLYVADTGAGRIYQLRIEEND